jgi:hypothetical protein
VIENKIEASYQWNQPYRYSEIGSTTNILVFKHIKIEMDEQYSGEGRAKWRGASRVGSGGGIDNLA